MTGGELLIEIFWDLHGRDTGPAYIVMNPSTFIKLKGDVPMDGIESMTVYGRQVKLDIYMQADEWRIVETKVEEAIHFKALGFPVAQGRPKAARISGQVIVYDPKKSKSWKESVKWQAIENMRQGSSGLLEGALLMSLYFHLPRPKGLPKKVIHHIKKPDIDNLVKAVKDALKGICYHDDSQIIHLVASKEYSVEPGVVVTIAKKDS